MPKSLPQLLTLILNRRVTWTDKKGVIRFGTLREVRRDHLWVEQEPFGASATRKTRVAFDQVKFAGDTSAIPEDRLTHLLWKESTQLWKWEIRINGEVWRKRRGFRSHRTANESLRTNLLEAADAVRDLYPPPEAIAASHLWRADFIKSRLGPATFYDRLSPQRKQFCQDLLDDLNRVANY
jgi:hypothetical protein